MYMYCSNYTVRDICITIYSTVFKYLRRPRFGYLNRWFVKLVDWLVVWFTDAVVRSSAVAELLQIL